MSRPGVQYVTLGAPALYGVIKTMIGRARASRCPDAERMTAAEIATLERRCGDFSDDKQYGSRKLTLRSGPGRGLLSGVLKFSKVAGLRRRFALASTFSTNGTTLCVRHRTSELGHPDTVRDDAVLLLLPEHSRRVRYAGYGQVGIQWQIVGVSTPWPGGKRPGGVNKKMLALN
jgi:hypothetical protein